MIFSSEQPQTGMNEGTWLSQGMCIKNEGIFCREGNGGGVEKNPCLKKLRQGFIIVIKSYFAKLTDLVSRITVILTCPG